MGAACTLYIILAEVTCIPVDYTRAHIPALLAKGEWPLRILELHSFDTSAWAICTERKFVLV